MAKILVGLNLTGCSGSVKIGDAKYGISIGSRGRYIEIGDAKHPVVELVPGAGAYASIPDSVVKDINITQSYFEHFFENPDRSLSEFKSDLHKLFKKVDTL